MPQVSQATMIDRPMVSSQQLAMHQACHSIAPLLHAA
jgi:hypothetical protein